MRNENWTAALMSLIKEWEHKPFAWGIADCCLFAADCAIAVCGVDPAEKYRGKYKTERGAKSMLLKNHGSLEAAWDAYFNRIDPRLAQRGDVVAYTSPTGRAVGVVWSGGVWSTTEDGVAQTDCTPEIAWRIARV